MQNIISILKSRNIDFSHISKFHEALNKSKCSIAEFKVAELAYEAQLMMLLTCQMEIMVNKDIQYHSNQGYLRQRCGIVSKEAIEFLTSSKPGDIWNSAPIPKKVPLIEPFSVRADADQCAFDSGHNYVLINFVDCNVLLNGQLRRKDNGPIKIFGFDTSCYNVAKTSVVFTMMKLGAPAYSVAQVWFSSCWSKETLSHFKKAIEHLKISQAQEENEAVHHKVKFMISHWADTEPQLPVSEGMKQWSSLFNHLSSAYDTCASLKREEDQVYMTKYILNGKLFDDSNHCASMTLFNLPDMLEPMKQGHLCHYALKMDQVISKNNSAPLKSLVEEYLVSQIQVLKQWLSSNQLQVQVQYIEEECISASSAASASFCEQVKKLNPWVITWSNIADYMPLLEFHKLARACSTVDTVHAASSSNWSRIVFGTDISDLPAASRHQMISAAMNMLTTLNILKMTCGNLLHSKISTHYRNILQWTMCNNQRHKYVSHFFEGEIENPRQVNYTLAGYSVFLDNPSTLFMTWSYNPEIKIRGNEEEMDKLFANAAVKKQSKQVCANCGKKSDLKQCSACKNEQYCSRECQQQHWAEHKKVCKKK